MSIKYGIDFGTTNSSIGFVYKENESKKHIIVADIKNTLPREVLPSLVYVNEDGVTEVGEAAIALFYQNAKLYDGRQLLVRQIKLDLEEHGAKFKYKVGKIEVSGVDLIAAILRKLKDVADVESKDLEIDVHGVVMGVPVQYGDLQKNVLKLALIKAGYYQDEYEAEQLTQFVSEPVAVAVTNGLELDVNQNVLVFDFGGGTLDLAIMNLKKQVEGHEIKPHVTIAKKRLTLGGELITKKIFINCLCSKDKYGTKEISKALGVNFADSDKLWEYLGKTEDGNRFIAKLEECKFELSKQAKSKFFFLGQNGELKAKFIFRDELKESILKELKDIDELIEDCLEDAGMDEATIDKVILAGGSSLIPCVQKLLTNQFGNVKVIFNSDDEVLTSIVRGLATIGGEDIELVNDAVDNDYGFWDVARDQFTPVIEKNTLIKDTKCDKIKRTGLCKKFVAAEKHAQNLKISIFQSNIKGYTKLGTINISNPSDGEYQLFMSVDVKKNVLNVFLYDVERKTWVDIPLDETEFPYKP